MDENDETNDRVWLTKLAAAKLLECDPRSIDRYVARQELTRNKHGKYDSTEVETLAEHLLAIKEGGNPTDPSAAAMTELRLAFEGSQGLVERLFRMIEAPLERVLAASDAGQRQMAELVERQSKAYFDAATMIGDLVMRKEEAVALREQSKARSETIMKVGTNLARFMPKLLEQVAGQSSLKDFLDTLPEDKKGALWAVAEVMALDDDGQETVEGRRSKEKFEALLAGAGIAKPVEPASMVVELNNGN